MEITRTSGQQCGGLGDLLEKPIKKLGEFARCSLASWLLVYPRDYLN